MLTEANAIRTNSIINVTLFGQFLTPFDEVKELGYFPGDEVRSARIFLSEGRKSGYENINVMMGLGKIWTINREFLDNQSRTIEVFVNGQFVKKIRIKEFSQKGLINFH